MMSNSDKLVEKSKTHVYKFRNFYLNTSSRKVFRLENFVEITPKAFDILQMLIEKQGEVVSKDELLGNVWDGLIVEEANLAVYVSKLRKLLDAEKDDPLIETISGVGYRFVSKVKRINENEWNNLVSANSKRHFTRLDSILVLPLTNENGDAEIDYLADGITESLINSLSYIPNLRVIARNTAFRYKDANIDIQKVGKELDVSTILTGRIRKIQNRLIIGIELTKLDDLTQLWGTQINRAFEDIFEVQEDITQSILENLKTQIDDFANKQLSQTLTQNAEAYRLYLKGRYILNKGTIESTKKSIKYFQQSITQDPTYTIAYISMAYSYRLLFAYEEISRDHVTNKTKSLLEKASELNSEIPELYLVKGDIAQFLEFDFKEAERNFKKALELNPNSVEAYYRYSKLLVCIGKSADALKQIKEASRLDPVSTYNNKNIAKTFYLSGQFENAIARTKEALDLEPEDYQSLQILGVSLIALERFDEAIDILNKAIDIQPHYEVLALTNYAYEKSGRKEEAEKIVNFFKEESKENFISPMYWASIYAGLEDADKLFECLEESFKLRMVDLTGLLVDPKFKFVKNDPRYIELLRKMGLPTDL